MSGDDRSNIPGDWDALADRKPEMDSPKAPASWPEKDGPQALTVMASAWADLVGILAVCTAALVAILLLGERPALPAFAWAAALALLWWLFAAAILIIVRQATPGMLLAGVSFSEAVPPRRVGWVLAAALVGVATLGVSGVLGGDGSLLRLAAASDVVDGPA
jgi:hypothetical protein